MAMPSDTSVNAVSSTTGASDRYAIIATNCAHHTIVPVPTDMSAIQLARFLAPSASSTRAKSCIIAAEPTMHTSTATATRRRSCSRTRQVAAAIMPTDGS